MRTNNASEIKSDGLNSIPFSGLPSEPHVNHSLGVKVALTALRIYKVYLSILFAGNCRFQPTCSVYMYEATERFGVMRGSWMGLKRLLRCQPLSRKFGYDPVPEKSDVPAPANVAEHRVRPSNATSREAHS